MLSRRAFLAGSTAALAGCSAPTAGASLSPLADRPGDDRAFAQFQGGLRNRGYVDRRVPDAVRVDWTLPVNRGEHSAAKSSPVPAPGGDVVICGDTGTVRRVAPDGTVRWAAEVEPTTRGIHGTPAVANGTAYVGAYDGAMYAFDLADGTRQWRRPLGDAIGSSPVYLEGIVYVAVEYGGPASGSVAAVDAASGRQVWGDGRPTNHPHSTIAIDPEAGRLVVGANDGRLYAWTFPGLERAWTFETGEPIKGPIAVHDALAVFGSWDEYAYGVDLVDGSEVWSHRTGADVMTGPAIDPGGTAYVGSHDGAVHALDAGTGEERWRFETDGPIVGSLTATPGHVLVGSYDTRLYAVDVGSGEETWSVAGSGSATSAPLVTDEAVYYAERSRGEPPGLLYRLVAD